MTMRTIEVTNHAEVDERADEYIREGYEVLENAVNEVVLRKRDHGSLIAHLVLFFTFGWLTLGALNLVYALYRRRKTTDRVRITAE